MSPSIIRRTNNNNSMQVMLLLLLTASSFSFSTKRAQSLSRNSECNKKTPTFVAFAAAIGSSSSSPSEPVTTMSSLSRPIEFQMQHSKMKPSSVMSSIATSCDDLGIDEFDVYGDFQSDKEKSYLRRFEAEIAQEFNKDDAVFMPSGVMAQSIALLIHSGKKTSRWQDDEQASSPSSLQMSPPTTTKRRRRRFACHYTSHLILHEEHAYHELLGMDALVISSSATTDNEKALNDMSISLPPMRLSDVQNTFAKEHATAAFRQEPRGAHDVEAKEEEKRMHLLGDHGLVALIMELPHRELGGKLTPWEDVIQIGKLCRDEGIKYHCDGARIFEASAGYGLSLSEMASQFDSVYISFYKGLGAISGAMLLGDSTFCAEARVWLRRFGGNLFTLLPYAVSCWAGYRKHWVGENNGMTFYDKQEKMNRLVRQLSSDKSIQKIVTFDPEIPQTNMVHGYLRASLKACEEARDAVEAKTNIRVLTRMREIPPSDPVGNLGFGTKFEWAIGGVNGAIGDDVFLQGWKEFASLL